MNYSMFLENFSFPVAYWKNVFYNIQCVEWIQKDSWTVAFYKCKCPCMSDWLTKGWSYIDQPNATKCHLHHLKTQHGRYFWTFVWKVILSDKVRVIKSRFWQRGAPAWKWLRSDGWGTGGLNGLRFSHISLFFHCLETEKEKHVNYSSLNGTKALLDYCICEHRQ